MTTQTESWARPEERPWLRRATEWVEWVRQHHVWKLTDFLSPRELHLLDSVVRHHGLVLATYGGAPFAERKRALIMPDNWYPENGDFQVVLLSVQNGQNTSMSHGSILGSVLGTGLDRRKIGDIFTHGNESVLAVCHDVVGYLRSEWQAVGREGIMVSEIPDGTVTLDAPVYSRKAITVASLRLDAVIAQACQWSRSDAQSAVTSGKVSLNFVVWTRPDASVEEGDVLSVRGFGRIRVETLSGTSKRGRDRVEVGILRSSQRNRDE